MDEQGEATTANRPPLHSYTALAQMWISGAFDELDQLDDDNLRRLSYVLKRMKPRDKRWDDRRRVRYIGGIDV